MSNTKIVKRGVKNLSKKIEIYVACHKPSELPKNNLFCPIHVGAAKSKIVMPGLLRDDDGDNISEKNPQYCELTAQYWAWKHSDADYIGLCHYRRYLSFTDERFENFTADNRRQVLVKVLNPDTEEKYGLLDESQMKYLITSNDILVGEAQDLTKVSTPFGLQDNVLKHWQAHDMALINIDDLNKMFSIIERDHPDFYNSMKEYMNGKLFYGFNTFVMKREFFLELCDLEFDILSKLEQVVDISHYNQQLSRIYGFMGEIIFSAYVYHIHKTRRNVKIKECQVLYFDKTDPLTHIKPKFLDAMNVVVDLENVPSFLLYPFLNQFISNINKNINYELIILAEKISPQYKKYFKNLMNDFENVNTSILETDYYYSYIEDMYGEITNAAHIFLPWILPNFEKCLYLRWNTFIESDLLVLYNQDLQENPIAAVKDVFHQGMLNTFYQDEKNYCEENLHIENIFDFVNDNVLLMDLEKMRRMDFSYVAQQVSGATTKNDKKPVDIQLFNMIYQGYITFLPQNFNNLIVSNSPVKFFIQEAPLELTSELKKTADEAIIHRYDRDMPWVVDDDTDINFFIRYWKIVNQSELAPIFNNHNIFRSRQNASTVIHGLIDKIFPKGTQRRERVKNMFPRSGLVYKTLQKFIKGF